MEKQIASRTDQHKESNQVILDGTRQPYCDVWLTRWRAVRKPYNYSRPIATGQEKKRIAAAALAMHLLRFKLELWLASAAPY